MTASDEIAMKSIIPMDYLKNNNMFPQSVNKDKFEDYFSFQDFISMSCLEASKIPAEILSKPNKFYFGFYHSKNSTFNYSLKKDILQIFNNMKVFSVDFSQDYKSIHINYAPDENLSTSQKTKRNATSIKSFFEPIKTSLNKNRESKTIVDSSSNSLNTISTITYQLFLV